MTYYGPVANDGQVIKDNLFCEYYTYSHPEDLHTQDTRIVTVYIPLGKCTGIADENTQILIRGHDRELRDIIVEEVDDDDDVDLVIHLTGNSDEGPRQIESYSQETAWGGSYADNLDMQFLF
ncbi:hypothetical protein N7488_001765 [Penicillium malachiteum]|nr:hypothetical protein N7488_001765 [Penicillium malachiteum]